MSRPLSGQTPRMVAAKYLGRALHHPSTSEADEQPYSTASFVGVALQVFVWFTGVLYGL